MKLAGTFTALVTPFHEGEYDRTSFYALLEEQMEAGVAGVVLLGTTGESSTLSEKEKEQIVRDAVQKIEGRLAIIVGTTHNSTKQTIENTQKAKKWGAQGALIATPYYNKPTQEGLYRHYEAISTSVDLPFIVYNIPGRTGVNMEPATFAKIATLSNAVGMKESSGNLFQASEMLAQCPSGFSFLAGDDALALPLIALGAHGVISVVSNFTPHKVNELIHAALKNDLDKARTLHHALQPLFKGAFLETNPICIKEMLASAKKIKSNECRLPLTAASTENKTILKQLVDNFI